MMKKIIIFLIINLASGFAFAQAPLDVLDKIKEIKPLESSRDDVKRILADFESSDDDDYYQNFSKDDWDIDISYSSGSCFREEDEENDKWNFPIWTVTKIEIDPPDSIKVKDLGYNLSEFKKEQRYANVEDFFVYHSKDLGVMFDADENGVQTILFIPPRRDSSRTCDNNEEAKKFYAAESWFGDLKLEDRNYIVEGGYANVVDLILSETEITAGCSGDSQNKSCSDEIKEISVKTIGNDPENDVLTYNYTVSGGKIIGEGSDVVWDLTGVKPGTYTITAGVDDGCGVCGQTKTQTVIVKECSDCAVNSQKKLDVKTEISYQTKRIEETAKTNRKNKITNRSFGRNSRVKLRKSPKHKFRSSGNRKQKMNTDKTRTKVRR